MRDYWYGRIEAVQRRTGFRMHVCLYAYCKCLDCAVDPALRLATRIDRSEPQAPKVIGGAL